VSGHTPGPWKAVDLRHQKGGQVRIVSDNTDEIRAGRYNHVANVLAGGDRPAEDAKLIASAPEQQAKIKALADALEAFAAIEGPSANTRASRSIGKAPLQGAPTSGRRKETRRERSRPDGARLRAATSSTGARCRPSDRVAHTAAAAGHLRARQGLREDRHPPPRGHGRGDRPARPRLHRPALPALRARRRAHPHAHWPKALDCEIKGLNPYTGEKIHSVQDIRESRQVWVRKYYDQLQTYLLLHGEELGVFVLFNKSPAGPPSSTARIDYEYAEGLLKKAERLKLAVATDAPPDRVAGPECQKCPFLHVCGPDIDYGKGAAFVDDAELEAKLRRMAEIEAQADEYAALEKDVKKSLPQTEGEYLIGEFVVVQKLQTRKAYVANVKASSFFKTDISRLTK
jgi:hypothetical protein